jgi:ADP-ribose pyrophosphatase YjhB (NUDIX family)
MTQKAVRAIIIKDHKTLVMYRNKEGSEYYTLVGGGVDENETFEEALIREVKEETGLSVTNLRLVFIENHQHASREQYIYLCDVSGSEQVALQNDSEEALLNRFGLNLHKPLWVDITAFSSLPFRTPALQQALDTAFKKGFPDKTVVL